MFETSVRFVVTVSTVLGTQSNGNSYCSKTETIAMIDDDTVGMSIGYSTLNLIVSCVR